jgi:ATP-binding cassette subfamily B protein
VVLALLCLVAAKVANLGVPLLLKHLVDAMNLPASDPRALLVVPAGLLLGYAALRLSASLFTELRELVFAKATHGASREIALQVFRHMHALSLRFHLERQTGGMTRDIERGTRALQSLISYSLYTILPTLVELGLALALLGGKFDMGFVWITLGALVAYGIFTISLTEWRTQFRRRMNELDSKAHQRAVDALLNYETVKYFNNEDFEARRYDEGLDAYRRAQITSQTSLSLLNVGQQAIIALSLLAMLWRATAGVVAGHLTLGDLVLINTLLIQLYIPLNFLGVLYREVKQSLTDLDKMFTLMGREREVADAPEARPLQLQGAAVRFEAVDFAYDPARPILRACPSTSRPARRWPWWAPAARARARWRGCSTASTTCRAGASPSTGRTSARSRRTACARPSASSRRTRCCSTTPSPTTSPTAGPTPRRPRWRRWPAPPASTTSSSPSPRATTPWWASAA